jgi:hypothetical protein
MIKNTRIDKYILHYNLYDGKWYARAPWQSWYVFDSWEEGAAALNEFDELNRWNGLFYEGSIYND